MVNNKVQSVASSIKAINIHNNTSMIMDDTNFTEAKEEYFEKMTLDNSFLLQINNEDFMDDTTLFEHLLNGKSILEMEQYHEEIEKMDNIEKLIFEYDIKLQNLYSFLTSRTNNSVSFKPTD